MGSFRKKSASIEGMNMVPLLLTSVPELPPSDQVATHGLAPIFMETIAKLKNRLEGGDCSFEGSFVPSDPNAPYCATKKQ